MGPSVSTGGARAVNRAPKERASRVVAATVSELARRTAVARRILEDSQTAWPPRRNSWRGQPARHPAFVRDPSARARRGPPRHSDDARPFRSLDDTDLHACSGSAAAKCLRTLSPPRLIFW